MALSALNQLGLLEMERVGGVKLQVKGVCWVGLASNLDLIFLPLFKGLQGCRRSRK